MKHHLAASLLLVALAVATPQQGGRPGGGPGPGGHGGRPGGGNGGGGDRPPLPGRPGSGGPGGPIPGPGLPSPGPGDGDGEGDFNPLEHLGANSPWFAGEYQVRSLDRPWYRR